jgi:DNA-binding transcriptional ArsR family regulator
MTTEPMLDLTGLRALAHPLRVHLLALLRTQGPSTATALGAELGESSGSTSYHLRQLAAAGLIVEDEGRGNGRERWWRAAHAATHLQPADFADSPEAAPALHAFLTTLVAAAARRAQQFVDEAASWPKRWQAAADLSDYGLSLSADELAQLNADVAALVESRRRPPRKGDHAVLFQFQSFPTKSPQP